MWIASRTCWKVPQRQMLVIAASMSASLAWLLLEERGDCHDHGPTGSSRIGGTSWSSQAFCTLCSVLPVARPSMVVIFAWATAETVRSRSAPRARRRGRCRRALRDAAAVLGAGEADLLADHQSRGVVGSTSTSWDFPLMVRRIPNSSVLKWLSRRKV